MVCSVGMLVFNKEAIRRFPLECLLVALQMLVTSLWMVGPCRRSLHFGSTRDVLRWCMVVPFFCGMLLSSILALKNVPHLPLDGRPLPAVPPLRLRPRCP